MKALHTVQVGDDWTITNGKGLHKQRFASELEAADYAVRNFPKRQLTMTSNAAVEQLQTRWQIEGATYAAAGFPESVCWNYHQAQGYRTRIAADQKAFAVRGWVDA